MRRPARGPFTSTSTGEHVTFSSTIGRVATPCFAEDGKPSCGRASHGRWPVRLTVTTLTMADENLGIVLRGPRNWIVTIARIDGFAENAFAAREIGKARLVQGQHVIG